MGSRYEVEVTVCSARDLKNVNWRHGDLKPYAVLWVDDGAKCSSRVDLDNGDSPAWDEMVVAPLPPSSRIEDAVLYIDVVHADVGGEEIKPLVGSARLPLRDVVDDAGIGGRVSRDLRLKRPSGRPQGRLDVRVAVREIARYGYGHDASPYPAPYGQPAGSRDLYGAAPPAAYGSAGYGGLAYGAAPPAGYPSSYGAAAAAAPAYVVDGPKKQEGMGMGTGLAMGAAAGVLSGLALAGGASYLEDKFEDAEAEKVEEESYGGGFDDFGGDDDDY